MCTFLSPRGDPPGGPPGGPWAYTPLYPHPYVNSYGFWPILGHFGGPQGGPGGAHFGPPARALSWVDASGVAVSKWDDLDGPSIRCFPWLRCGWLSQPSSPLQHRALRWMPCGAWCAYGDRSGGRRCRLNDLSISTAQTDVHPVPGTGAVECRPGAQMTGLDRPEAASLASELLADPVPRA